MRFNLAIGLAVAVATAASATSVSGQEYRGSAGWYGGVLWVTSLNSGVGSPSVDVEPGPSPTFGVHYDHWLGRGIVGLRVNGAWGQQNIDWSDGKRKVYVYSGDVDLLFRLIPPNPARPVSIFVAGGAGVMRYGLGYGPRSTFEDANARYFGSEGWKGTALAGLGFDFITPWTWGDGPIVVRIEGADVIQLRSPLKPASGHADFDVAHGARVTLGMHTGIGFLGR